MTKDETKLAELNKELDELQAKIKEVQEAIEEAKEEAKQAEWPKYGDKYWSLFGAGYVYNCVWMGAESDINRQSMGNIFRTEEEAEFEKERLKVIAELKKFAMTREEVWAARHTKSVCYLYLDSDNDLNITNDCTVRTPGVLYFESNDTVWKAVAAVGEERIKKYYAGNGVF